jgi:hypothetical protein
MLFNVTRQLQDLGLHIFVLKGFLNKLAKEDLLLFFKSHFVTSEAIHFLLFFLEQISDHSIFFLRYLELSLKLLNFILNLKLLAKLLRDILLDFLYQVLSISDRTCISFYILIDQMKILVIVMDSSIMLHQLVSNVILVHVEGVNDASFLLDLIDDLLLLLLETLSCLLFAFNFFVNSFSFILQLLKVSLKMLNGLLEVFVTLAYSYRLVSVFHIFLLKSLNLVLLLLLFLFHAD